MRITYRTVRVLSAISDAPGASNRAVADLAGIVDVGQISRLLRRLQDLGLICNTRSPKASAGANSWVLTEAGEQVLRFVNAGAAHRRAEGDGRALQGRRMPGAGEPSG